MSDMPGRVGQESIPQKSDPTALTTDALQREIAHLNALLEAKFFTIVQSIQDQKDLRIAQLANIQQQLSHAEALRRELKEDNEKNIDRALLGVEKATEKLESNLTRTLGQVIDASKADVQGLRRDIDSLKDRINDNKERISGIEAQKIGAKEDRSGLYATMAAFSGLVLLGIAVLVFVTGK